MTRILLDQGLAPEVAALLRSDGWDARHVIEIGLDRAEDLQILQFASRDARTCITLDHDFHAHLARAAVTRPSVVLVRIEGLSAWEQAALIRRVWAACEDAIVEGAAVSVGARSIRVRRLPLL